MIQPAADRRMGKAKRAHHFAGILFSGKSLIGLRALKRAAQKVASEAKKNNYKIPVWRDGRIEYIIPEIDDEQNSLNDTHS